MLFYSSVLLMFVKWYDMLDQRSCGSSINHVTIEKGGWVVLGKNHEISQGGFGKISRLFIR